MAGRALFLDIDTVICGDMTPMFEVEGRLVCLDSRPWRYKEGPARTGTGVFAFDTEESAKIHAHFHSDKDRAFATYSNEQDFIHGEFRSLFNEGISYWPDEEHILRWKENTEHMMAQDMGKQEWYENYSVEVVEVMRRYSYPPRED